VQAVSASPVTAASEARGGRRGARLEAAIWTGAMAVLVGATLASVDTQPYLALDIAIGVASLALVPFLARWPVQAAIALSLLAAVSPAATPPATMAALLVGWLSLASLRSATPQPARPGAAPDSGVR